MTTINPDDPDEWPAERWDAEEKRWEAEEKRWEGFAAGDIYAAKKWVAAFFGQSLTLGKILDPKLTHETRANDLADCAYRFPTPGKDVRDDRGHWDEQSVKELIEAADAGDEDAHQAVCLIIAWHWGSHWGESHQAPLPLFLHGFLRQLLEGIRVKPARRRGWGVANYLRDEYLMRAVDRLTKQGGFPRTRNPATDKPSACSIVAEALAELGVDISEKTVAEITVPMRWRWLTET